MPSKMSTVYSSGLSALIQAATSQLGDLAETNTSETDDSPEGSGSPPMLSNPTTPTLEDAELYLDETSSWHQRGYTAATITPLLTSNQGPGVTVTVTAKFLFPEVLMCLLVNPAYEDIVTFLPDGKYFAIRRVDFTNLLLYKHFHTTSFEIFLELTRGWGFIRVNGNINEDGTNNNSNTNNGTNCNESSINNNNNNKNNNSNIKTDIYVFRHPHFEKNQPVDMNKIRLNRKHSRSSTGDEVPPRIILEKAVSEGSHTSDTTINSNYTNRRQLSPSHANKNRDSEDYNHRLRSKPRRPLPVDVVDPLSLSGSSCDRPAQQMGRRSSLELRGVAQAITASKLHLNSGELINETDNCCYENNNNNNSNDHDSPMLNNNNNNDSSNCPSPAQLEQRQSSVSSLVDGGVETATHNIVTDAIEALLFDESHTRETYNRHEKELSVSSLPGVVPISKQLFSASKNKNSSSNKDGASETTSGDGGKKSKRKSKGRARKTTSKPQSSSSSSSSSSSWAIHTTIGSLEDASRNNGGGGSSSSFLNSNNNLRVIIPSSDGGEVQRRGSYGSMVVSPARMEAAAALVSQSRNRNDEEL